MSWLVALAISMAPYVQAVDHLEHGYDMHLETLPPVVWVDDCTYGYGWYQFETIYLCRSHDWERSAVWGTTLEVVLRHELVHAWQLEFHGPKAFLDWPEWRREGMADFVAHDGDCARATYFHACERFAKVVAEWEEATGAR